MTDDAVRDAIWEKYGRVGTNCKSEAEAKETAHGYGKMAWLFKLILMDYFGKNYSYTIEDAEYSDNYFHLEIYVDGNTFVHTIGVTFRETKGLVVEAQFEDLPPLDCEFDDLLEEIESKSNEWGYDYDEDTPWELDLSTSEEYDDGKYYVSCLLTIHVYGKMFEGLPTVDKLDEYFEGVNDIIVSHCKGIKYRHKKKTAKNGS